MRNKLTIFQTWGLLCVIALLTTHCVVNPGTAPAVPKPVATPVPIKYLGGTGISV